MVAPGTVAAALAVLTMVRAGVRTGTEVVQAGSAPPEGQLFPGAAELRVAVRTWLPVSGSSTVTVPVTVTVPPMGMSPVQVTPVAVTVRVPEVAVWSPLGTASSNTSVASVAMVIPS